MNVAIIGFGVEGRSALHYWQDLGASVTICDANPDVAVPPGVSRQLGKDYLGGLEQFDIIVRSAGINPQVILSQNPAVAGKITTVINEFIRVSPTRNLIGVTGTKGKGTTSTLIAAMLEAAGKKAYLGGNIGRSPFEFLKELTPDDYVILELSSYQLVDLRVSPHIAVCLMMAPEHLNWHEGLDNYVQAKSQLFAHQTKRDIAIYFADNELSHQIASRSPGAKIAYYAPPGAYLADGKIIIDDQELCKTSELRLLGRHNWQNACAAATAVWQIVQAPGAIHKVLGSFSGLPHRLEFVAEKENVQYYNDSYASAPPAAEAALLAIPNKKVLILGGFDRQLPLDLLVKTILSEQNSIRALLLVGASAQRLAAELEAANFTHYSLSTAKTMHEIVQEAQRLAKKGDAVVLSPGFPSFDMFKDFEVRGNQFKAEVNSL